MQPTEDKACRLLLVINLKVNEVYEILDYIGSVVTQYLLSLLFVKPD